MDKMTNPDFMLFTDGSSYDQDLYGGWAAYARTPDKSVKLFRMGAVSGTTVDRAEMTAILEGLNMVLEASYAMPRQIPMGQHHWKPRVQLFSDRENLVLSIQAVYARSNNPDLWKRFEYFEAHMVIDANHVADETAFEEFVLVDLHASSARIMVKNYADCCNLPANRLPKIK